MTALWSDESLLQFLISFTLLSATIVISLTSGNLPGLYQCHNIRRGRYLIVDTTHEQFYLAGVYLTAIFGAGSVESWQTDPGHRSAADVQIDGPLCRADVLANM